MSHFLGLRTAIYAAPDLVALRDWYTQILGFGPYFDEPFYVGFNVGGYELGLDPAAPPQQGGGVYWGVADAASALSHLLSAGATPHEALQDVGDGILVAKVLDPAGNVLGIIQNPHFVLP
jgi:catechol 2,3-dioxygenase-like lactoylglutathione lyase family enzyme